MVYGINPNYGRIYLNNKNNCPILNINNQNRGERPKDLKY